MSFFSIIKDNWVVITGSLTFVGVVAAIPQSIKAIPMVEFIATVTSNRIEPDKPPFLSLRVLVHCRSASSRVRDDSRQCSQELQEFWFPGTDQKPGLELSPNLKDSVSHSVSGQRDQQTRPLHVLRFMTPLRGGDQVVINVAPINGKVDDGDFQVKNKHLAEIMPTFECVRSSSAGAGVLVSQWTCTERINWIDKVTSLLKI